MIKLNYLKYNTIFFSFKYNNHWKKQNGTSVYRRGSCRDSSQISISGLVVSISFVVCSSVAPFSLGLLIRVISWLTDTWIRNTVNAM